MADGKGSDSVEVVVADWIIAIDTGVGDGDRVTCTATVVLIGSCVCVGEGTAETARIRASGCRDP